MVKFDFGTIIVLPSFFISFFIFFILERGERRERNIVPVFHLFMHSSDDPCMSPDQGPNPQS